MNNSISFVDDIAQNVCDFERFYRIELLLNEKDKEELNRSLDVKLNNISQYPVFVAVGADEVNTACGCHPEYEWESYGVVINIDVIENLSKQLQKLISKYHKNTLSKE